jgi:nitroreductase
MEAGHAAQNIYLQSVSLNLGTVLIGGFNETLIKKTLNLNEEEPLYILPIGKI